MGIKKNENRDDIGNLHDVLKRDQKEIDEFYKKFSQFLNEYQNKLFVAREELVYNFDCLLRDYGKSREKSIKSLWRE